MNFDNICKLISEAGSDSPRAEAFMLIEKFCGITRASVLADRERDFASPELDKALEKRLSHVPLQYIIGEWYFADEKYFVDENCLIPRPDTELLLDKACELLPRSAVFADLCTGSGCIAISALRRRPDTRAFAAELYPNTLRLAVKNAESNGVSERFTPICADVLLPLDFGGEKLDAIISNPPYIRTDVIDTLSDEVKHEPRAALDGGRDGMDFYRAILSLHTPHLKENGFIAFEIGYDEGKAIEELADSHGFGAELFRDFGGNDRVAILTKRI